MSKQQRKADAVLQAQWEMYANNILLDVRPKKIRDLLKQTFFTGVVVGISTSNARTVAQQKAFLAARVQEYGNTIVEYQSKRMQADETN